jgi:type VI secretion system protein VasG
MISRDLKKLLQKLNAHSTRALEAATGFCISRTHYEVSLEHLLVKLLDDGTGDIPRILDHFDVEEDNLWKLLLERLEALQRGNTGRPSFSPQLLQLIESAWLVASVHHNAPEIRSGHLLEAFVESDAFRADEELELLASVRSGELRDEFMDIVAGSVEDRPAATERKAGKRAPRREGETALDLYTMNITARAREGEIDPVFARDREIRQMIDILGRRRKNNPILVGEAGVGKTAVVEGLALRIAEEDVPDNLAEIDIHTLDLGLLKAGAGVKGEFEDRLKSVIQEVREAPRPIVLFIDEAHTLIGAGGAAGTGDAANLLKPALARGELRTVAATTWSEYKKHIEKDAALERRFQRVKIEEPSIADATIMLRGIKGHYEHHHEVHISDRAAEAAARLSERFISGRHLPDKAVDLIDTAASRVKMTQSAKPAALDDVERRLTNLTITIEGIERDRQAGLRTDHADLDDLRQQKQLLETERESLVERWQQENELFDRLQECRHKIKEGARGNGEEPVTNDRAELQKELENLEDERMNVWRDGEPLVHAEVNEEIVARIVSDWTGIPIGNMLKDEAELLLALEERLHEYIRGQDEPIREIAESIRAAKAGVGNPETPLGVFLLVGPSGVGKTETARMLAQTLFGGERFLTIINMSEYQESHTVAQLKGSPPGYVGYGEGGVLTEAVRRQPYAVVLLDEVEKAHVDVMELFYQVFDKGFMRDGEGREISFRNTVLMMTSNIGSDVFFDRCADEERPTPDQLRQAIHPLLVRQFQAALLGRMKVVPFYPLGRGPMEEITRLKLNKIRRRLQEAHGMQFDYEDMVVKRIADRCTEVDTGARNIDFIIDRTLLPQISRGILAKMTEEAMPERLTLALSEEGEFTYSFEAGKPAPSDAV